MAGFLYCAEHAARHEHYSCFVSGPGQRADERINLVPIGLDQLYTVNRVISPSGGMTE